MIDNNTQNDLGIHTPQDNELEKKESMEPITKLDDSIIDSNHDRIMQLEKQLLEFKERERDVVLRLKAEIENIRRRSIQEIEKVHKFSLERFVLELLPVIDNLERTLNIIDRSNTVFFAIMEGIELTLKSFLDTVYKFGVESIHEINVPFNPAIHQAISITESEEYESNQVLTIIQKGYSLNGRLIRPAMVTVSKFKN